MDEPVGRRAYVLTGVGLMLLKYALDASAIWLVTRQLWTPLDYLVPSMILRTPKIERFPWWLAIAMVLWTLPFLWIGVSMTLRRAVDAGRSPWLALAFFVPVVNYVVMLMLCAAPSRGGPEPPAWFFRAGIAYPVRAVIDGEDVGALRRCEFSTGAFVEPITAWDAPRRLSFDVVAQPDPMRELSPYRAIRPPHLDGAFRARRGELRLAALPDGRTRLEGSTWYTLELAPGGYWRLWADLLVHAIHARVLAHVKRLAEAG